MYVEGVKRNKMIFKQIYKVTLFVMSKESKVVYTYMNAHSGFLVIYFELGQCVMQRNNSK